jgi:hypothetical protein
MEGAAERAAKILRELFSDIQIELNHDKVASSALKNLVNKSDYFIFCWSSAKHAAFDAIKVQRRDLIYPTGKGSSSIVTSFLKEIQS